ncbi:MAG TPA: hemolysin family protein [Methanothrix sp.]|nr:hemolysin family protein [Methanothrix sp.]HQJ79931.1 hemolysin family protein [Methanothrix sp.]HUM80208.1 hemolysin family protein [Methanothrix sp.]
MLIMANGIFALSEIAVVTSRRSGLQQRRDEGDLGAAAALEMVDSPGHFLSTVQVGITLVGIMAGAYGGATIAEELAEEFRAWPAVAAYSDSLSLAIVIAAITYLSIVLGELFPKRLALSNPERIAALISPSMSAFSTLARPLVFVLNASTDLLLKIFGIKHGEQPAITEEEIRMLIDQGTTAGVIEVEEQDIVERVFYLGDQKTEAIMTPRAEIVWLDIDDAPEDIGAKITSGPFSIFPVCQGRLDRVIGIIQSKDVLSCSMSSHKVELRKSLLPPLFVPESMRALKVLERFKQTGIHLAIVVDEYGSVRGIVTLTDILEGLVGDIPHIEELEEPHIMRREDGSWLVDGAVPIKELKEALQIEQFPREGEGLYQTAGGLVMACLEKVPATGDYLEWKDYRFEVVDMDGQRIDKLLITLIKADAD